MGGIKNIQPSYKRMPRDNKVVYMISGKNSTYSLSIFLIIYFLIIIIGIEIRSNNSNMVKLGYQRISNKYVRIHSSVLRDHLKSKNKFWRVSFQTSRREGMKENREENQKGKDYK